MIQGPACVKERERQIATIQNQRRWLRGVESLELQKVARTSDRSSPWTLFCTQCTESGVLPKPVFYHMVSRMVIRMVSRMVVHMVILRGGGGGGTPYDYHMVKINHMVKFLENK